MSQEYIRYPQTGPTLPLSIANGGTGLSSGGSANQLLGMDSTATMLEYKTLSGTGSQVTVSNAANSITLSLPQNIATTSSPTFGGLTINNTGSGGNPAILVKSTNGTLGPSIAFQYNGLTPIPTIIADNSGNFEIGSLASIGGAYTEYYNLSSTGLMLALTSSANISWNTDGSGDIGITSHRPNNLLIKGGAIIGGSTSIAGQLPGIIRTAGVSANGVSSIIGASSNAGFTAVDHDGVVGFVDNTLGGGTNTLVGLAYDKGIPALLYCSANVDTGASPTTWATVSYSATGYLSLNQAGMGYRVKEGSNAKQGVATLSGGTVTVANTSVTASSRIFLTIQSLGTVTLPTTVGVTARTAATSFTITSADVTDTSVIAYEIFEPS